MGSYEKMTSIILNLEKGEIEGFRIGEKTPKSFNNKHMQDYESGYGIYFHESKLHTINVFFKSGHGSFNAYKGRIEFENNRYDFNKNTTSDDMVLIFGKPNRDWEDDVEGCIEYVFKKFRMEVIWNLEEKALDYISIEVLS